MPHQLYFLYPYGLMDSYISELYSIPIIMYFKAHFVPNLTSKRTFDLRPSYMDPIIHWAHTYFLAWQDVIGSSFVFVPVLESAISPRRLNSLKKISDMYALLYLFKNFFGCMWPFSSCRQWGSLSSCRAGASHCSGFSCCRAQALGPWASVTATCWL